MQPFRRAAIVAAFVLLAAAGCGQSSQSDQSSQSGQSGAPGGSGQQAPPASRVPLPAGLSMVGLGADGEPLQADEAIGVAHPASWARTLSIAAAPSYRRVLLRNGGKAVVVGLDNRITTIAADVAPVKGNTNLAFSPDERWLGWHIEREGVRVAELVDGAASPRLVALPAELGSTAKFAGWTADDRIVVAGKDALWTLTVEGKDAKRVAAVTSLDGSTGGGIQDIAHSYVHADPATGGLAYSDIDPATHKARIVFTDGTLAPKRTVPNRSLDGFTADGRFYVAHDRATAGDVRLVCTSGTDECRTLPQFTLTTPWPNGFLPMQPAAGTQRITGLVDPAGAQQVSPPAPFKAVDVSRAVLPTDLMNLVSKVAPPAPAG